MSSGNLERDSEFASCWDAVTGNAAPSSASLSARVPKVEPVLLLGKAKTEGPWHCMIDGTTTIDASMARAEAWRPATTAFGMPDRKTKTCRRRTPLPVTVSHLAFSGLRVHAMARVRDPQLSKDYNLG